MFSDFDLEAEGVPDHPLLDAPDSGDGRFRFRTPSLRNVALTRPYVHNGTLTTLKDVVGFYGRGVSRNANVARRGNRDGAARLSRNFHPADDMSGPEQADIIAFLEALSDPDFDRTVPSRVPSGLPPGGLID